MMTPGGWVVVLASLAAVLTFVLLAPRPPTIDRRMRAATSVLFVALLALGLSCKELEPPLAPRGPPVEQFVLPASFVATSDPHFGYMVPDSINAGNVQAINDVHNLSFRGEAVPPPSGVIVAGDLVDTHVNEAALWDTLLFHYDKLSWPLYEVIGNHDGPYVDARVDERHAPVGFAPYTWECGPVHMVALWTYSTIAISAWLEAHLDGLGAQRPVVIYQHFGFDAFALQWWTAEERDSLYAAIEGHNVLGIFHGHTHVGRHYTWRGFDVYSITSMKIDDYEAEFLVVTITGDRWRVAARHWLMDNDRRYYGKGHWDWSHQKPLSL